MDAFLINLDADTRRLSFVDEQLRRHGVSYERFSAIHASALSPEQSAYHQHPLRRDLSRPEIGCLLSHIGVWRRIVHNGSEAALVMEDDIHIAAGFGDLVRSMNLSAAAPEVHRLETVLATVTAQRAAENRVGMRRALELHTNHGGAAAYVLTQAAARLMLGAIERFTNPPDGELFDFDRRAVSGLRVIQWTPAPCIQDRHLHGGAIGLGSHLEADRLDIRTGLSRQPAAWRLRRLLRPAWRAAYDVAVRPTGRTRMFIPFG